jgi:antitoxin (DNA-binding transcriptional repressor) of toxin-antitoxin stability system
LARKLGDVLGRVRYRGESFVIERNGAPVARLGPVSGKAAGSLGEALRAWRGAGDADPSFADDLERVGATDRPPALRWDS